MRVVLGSMLTTILVIAVAADDKVEKIDVGKLIGKWQLKDKPGVTVDFRKDGKLKMAEGDVDVDPGAERTYTIDKNKIIIKTKKNGNEKVREHVVVKMTDNEIVMVNRGESDTLVRIKDKDGK